MNVLYPLLIVSCDAVNAFKLVIDVSTEPLFVSKLFNLLSVDDVNVLNLDVSTKSNDNEPVNVSNDVNLLFCCVCSTSTDEVYTSNSASLTKFASNEELKFSKLVILVSADCVNALIDVKELSVDELNELREFKELCVEDVKELILARELSTELVYVPNTEFLATCPVSNDSKLSNLESTDVLNGPSNVSNLLSTDAEYVVTLPIPFTVDELISPLIFKLPVLI